MSLGTVPSTTRTATTPTTKDYPTMKLYSKPEEVSPPPTPSNQNIILPPTPTVSDDEAEEEEEEKKKAPQPTFEVKDKDKDEDDDNMRIPHHISDKKMAEEIIQKNIKVQRRGTVSLADLIPMASAALRAKQCLLEESHNAPSQQHSTLARAITKVKLGLQTHRLKEKYLTNEWKRLAFGLPIDESTIKNTCNNYLIRTFSKYSPLHNSYDTPVKLASRRNSSSSNIGTDSSNDNSVRRTNEIVSWYEHYFKRTTLSIQELEARVDLLRQQKLLLHQQLMDEEGESFGSPSRSNNPPAIAKGNISRTKRSYRSSGSTNAKKEPHAYSALTTIVSN